MKIFRYSIFLLILLLFACGGNTYRGQGVFSNRSKGVIPFGVQASSVFGDRDDHDNLWVIVDVPYRNLQFERKAEGFVSEFEVTVALRNDEGLAIQLIDDSKTVVVESYDATQPDSLFARISRFLDAPPGQYRLEVIVTDRVSKGSGYYTKQVRVRDLSTQQLAMSDILLLAEPSGVFPSADLIIPTYRRRFNDTFYAFAQAKNVSLGNRLRARLSISSTGQRAAGGNVTEIDTIANANTINLNFTVPPTRLGLGRLNIKLEVVSNTETVAASSPLLVRWAKRPTTEGMIDDYVAPMRLIMNGGEWKELRDAPPDQQRRLISEFWESRNPTPETKSNLLEEEFYWRVGEANGQFAWGKRNGWQTDRGRIYIINGSPETITRHLDRRGRAIEIWRYEDPPREFLFYDDHGDGRFRLYRQSYSSL